MVRPHSIEIEQPAIYDNSVRIWKINGQQGQKSKSIVSLTSLFFQPRKIPPLSKPLKIGYPISGVITRGLFVFDAAAPW